ncbi:MAG: BatD family protein [Verrucomicrobiota bacterium]
MSKAISATLSLKSPLLMVLAFMVSSYSLLAQSDPGVTTRILSTRIAVGEPGRLEFRCENGQPEGAPREIDVPGLTVRFASESSNFNIINGQRSFSTSLFYSISGSKPGNYRIPSVTIRIRGKEFQTDAIDLQVFERTNQPNATQPDGSPEPYYATLTTGAETIYPNQLVPLELKAYAIGARSIDSVASADLAQNGIFVKPFRKNITNDREFVGDTIYSTATLPTHLFFMRPGEFKLGPATVVLRTIETNNNRQQGLFSIFTQTRPRQIASGQITVKVSPLPDAAPASFTGGIGNFDISGSATPNEMMVGDPISIQFQVDGIGNLETMTAPVANLPEDTWRTYEPKKEIVVNSDGSNPGNATFSMVAIPLKEVTELPPFEITFFDPAKHTYITKTIPAVPLKVSPDKTMTPAAAPSVQLSDSSDSEPSPPALPAAEKPEATFNDVLHIRTSSPKWRPYVATPTTPAAVKSTHVFGTICLLSMLGLFAFRKIRQHAARKDLSGSPKTFKDAVRKLSKSTPAADGHYQSMIDTLDLWEKENTRASQQSLANVSQVKAQLNAALYHPSKKTSLDDTEIMNFIRSLVK